MKAVIAPDYGPPENYQVDEVQVPRPGPGQLQVQIAAVSINPADVRVSSEEYRDIVPLEFPHIPGNDFAGTVSELGAGVTAYRVGDQVFGHAVPRALRTMAGASRPSLSTGALAEYAVFEADTPLLAHRPDGLEPEAAAALATTGLTALALLGDAKIQQDETVLVIGATGGVGTAVLPLLARTGATVIATGTPADADLLRRLGADEVIGYAEQEYPDGVDVVLNLVLPGDQLTAAARTVRSGGRLLTITYPVPQQDWIGRDDIDLRFVLDLDASHGGMREVGELAARGELVATIGRRYTFDEGPQACTDFLRLHTTGKLVVTI